MRDGEVAFEWFEREDYPNILRIMEDKHRLSDTYDEWEKSAEAGEQALTNSRHIVIRTIIESHSFAAWCDAHDVKANAQSRLRFCKEQHAGALDKTAPVSERVEEPSLRVAAQADEIRSAATQMPSIAVPRRRSSSAAKLYGGMEKLVRFFQTSLARRR